MYRQSPGEPGRLDDSQRNLLYIYRYRDVSQSNTNVSIVKDEERTQDVRQVVPMKTSRTDCGLPLSPTGPLHKFVRGTPFTKRHTESTCVESTSPNPDVESSRLRTSMKKSNSLSVGRGSRGDTKDGSQQTRGWETWGRDTADQVVRRERGLNRTESLSLRVQLSGRPLFRDLGVIFRQEYQFCVS